MMRSIRGLGRVCLVVVLALAGSACTLLQVNVGPRMAALEERTVAGTGEVKVLMVDIAGLMFSSPGRPSTPWAPGEDMAARLAEELDRAASDPRIKGLLVKINSPGGAVATADVLYHQIKVFRRKTSAPVVAMMMNVAASGGCYAALAADRIVALPTTVTGSIGVISAKLNLAGLMSRYGVESEAVKSAPLKDMWSPFRPASPEERQIMQHLIDDLFDRFKTVLQENRPNMTADQLRRAATAQVFTAAQALELGLIDQIGYPEDAFDAVKRMIGIDDARLVVYHRPGAHRATIYAQSPSVQGPDPAEILGLTAAPQLMYLWLPGLP